MLLLIDGTPGSEIAAFLQRLQEETLPCTIMTYEQWAKKCCIAQTTLTTRQNTTAGLLERGPHSACNREWGYKSHGDPEGIIFMRVMPEIAYKRLRSSVSLEHIKQIAAQKEEFFIHAKSMPALLQQLPILVLNGNIDFQTDFSQLYNHLFYIRRLVKQIQEKKDIAQGVYQEKVHRKCC